MTVDRAWTPTTAIVLCLNGSICLGLFWLLPKVWRLRVALAKAARTMNRLSDSMESSLAPAPMGLSTLRRNLHNSWQGVERWRSQLGFVRLLRWVGARTLRRK